MPPKRCFGCESPERNPRTPKRYCSYNSEWRRQEFNIDVGKGSLKKFSGMVLSSTDSSDYTTLLCARYNFLFVVEEL